MKVEFLDAASATNLDVPDIYYSAAYGATAEIIDGGTWECVVAEGGAYAFPYLRRPVPGHATSYDIVSPYGYGGVVAADPARSAEFVAAARTAGQQRGLVAEFLRTNPFDVTDPDKDGLQVDEYRAHPTFTVAVSGQDGVGNYWTKAEGRHRTAVRKAERSGVTLSVGDTWTLTDPLSPFRQLYGETMDRVGSSPRLKLPDQYYERIVSGLAQHLVLLEARIDSEPVAASLFMAWGDRVHYHLSGSTADGMKFGATNALLDSAVRTLVPDGGMLHMGGGVSDGDGLERFKRSLSNHATTVFLCRTVVDRERYHALVEARGADHKSDYFPAYRG